MRFPLLPASLVFVTTFLGSCGSTPTQDADLHSQDLRLPGGKIIHVETRTSEMEMMRGMMFRTSLAPDRGMLYVHKTPGLYSYWTYQYEIPLDMIWMDTGHRIVEIVENAQPCHVKASECPRFGGTKVSRYHLELAAGMAGKYGIEVGQRLEF